VGATIQKCKCAILNAIFTTALQDQVINVHPGHGVKIPPVPKKPLKIITATQFGALYEALPDADSQLLVETDIESGLRWGELTELRVKDLDFDTQILTVSRTVVELAPEFHPTGGRFLIKDYPRTASTGASSSAGRSSPSSRPTSRPRTCSRTTCSSASRPTTPARPSSRSAPFSPTN
jgi:integrase